jgi:hypothetical protein
MEASLMVGLVSKRSGYRKLGLDGGICRIRMRTQSLNDLHLVPKRIHLSFRDEYLAKRT